MRLATGASAVHVAANGRLHDRRDENRDDRAAEQQRRSLEQDASGQAAQKTCLHTVTVRGATKARCKYW